MAAGLASDANISRSRRVSRPGDSPGRVRRGSGGLKHGVNECGVAIGNEAVITKDQLPDAGLLGMDLVRLGLKRAATAREAADLIGGLIERFGQGGSSARDFEWRYSTGISDRGRH